jgi:mannitol/fructose-specific phosphotransferase system IIA component (Ntr-type)
MRLTEILSEAVIKVPLEGTNKSEIVRELVDLICQDTDRNAAEAIYQSVMERERSATCGIGHGIALPHGFSPSWMSFAAALGVAPQPVEFDAIDGEPVNLVFLIVSDEMNINTKLKALARISRLLHGEDFRRALAASESAAGAMRVIVDEEKRHRI